jgi:hypothetical protein
MAAENSGTWQFKAESVSATVTSFVSGGEGVADRLYQGNQFSGSSVSWPMKGDMSAILYL